MDWKINPSIRVALKTPRTLQLEVHEQQLANGCFGSECPRGTISLARAVGSHELGSHELGSTAAPCGWTGRLRHKRARGFPGVS